MLLFKTIIVKDQELCGVVFRYSCTEINANIVITNTDSADV